MAALPAALPTLEEVEDELSFNEVLMESLDPFADNYHTRAAELQANRAHYQSLLSDFQSSSRPQSQAGSQPQPDMDRSREPPGNSWWQAALNGRPGHDHSSNGGTSSSAYAAPYPPSSTPTNSAKRAFPQSSYLDAYERASKRPTPEPSNVGTPSSTSGSSELLDHEPAIERARQHQMAAEADVQRQREAQQADAALASELHNVRRGTPSAFASSSRPGIQTTLNYNGSFQRPPPYARPDPSSSAHPPRYPQPQAMNYQSQTHHTPQSFKAEPGFPRQQGLQFRPRQPMQVVDLTNDSESEDDLTEVAPHRWTPSHRQPVQPPPSMHFAGGRPLYTPTPTTMQMPATMQIPGAYPTVDQANRQYAYRAAAMNYNTGNPWLAQGMNAVHNAANNLGGYMRNANNLIYGSSIAQPVDIDSDDDDVIFGGARQLPELGNYTGNEDLYNTRYDQFASYDPTKSREEIQALLDNIRPDEDMPAHLRVQTPEDMTVKLHKYQELGLTWLKKCEEGSNRGGILADDMGLGKTIQMLSLMVTRKSDDPRCKTTLIVAPLALMRQWAQEIKSKLKQGRYQLTVFTHHGTKKAKDFDELRTYDVVLTTYGSIASELKKLERFRLRQDRDPDARPSPSEKCVFLDSRCKWYRIVLDEAQCIKNRSTQTAKGTCLLNAKYRFCVTGTPMMNNIEELYSLVHFLRIKPYSVWDRFRADFNTPLRSGSDEAKNKAMQMLQALCKAIMLRRTKKSTFEGQPILVLPDRSTQIDNPVFSEDEQSFYQALETRSALEFNKYLRRGTVGTSYSAILVLLLRLRQACCHPHLIKDFGVAAAADISEDQMMDMARQLDDATVARIKENGGNFECPVCYDVTPNPAIFIPCGHDACSECFTRIADPANALQNGEEVGRVRCPNCRGNIDPKRLTDFNSFKKVHMPELLTEEERRTDAEDDEVVFDESEDEDDSSTESDDEEEEEETKDPTLGGFIVNDDIEDGDDTHDDLDSKPAEVKHEEGAAGPSNVISEQADDRKLKATKRKGKDKAKDSKKKKGKGKKKAKKVKSSVTLAELKKLATRNKAAKKTYLHRLRKDFVSSAKLDKTMEILQEILEAKEGEKVLIFSQWTSLLDLLEIPIDEAGIGYRRYDGSMTAQMRGDAVDDFRDERQNIRVMLVSLKAGNAGLNLNMASQVIILDPFWNPYIEEQAIDRAHRIGQARPVKVHRVLIENTVEDRIIELQEKKRALISEALDEKSAANIARLGVQELAYLFGVTHDPSQRVNYVPRNQR